MNINIVITESLEKGERKGMTKCIENMEGKNADDESGI